MGVKEPQTFWFFLVCPLFTLFQQLDSTPPSLLWPPAATNLCVCVCVCAAECVVLGAAAVLFICVLCCLSRVGATPAWIGAMAPATGASVMFDIAGVPRKHGLKVEKKSLWHHDTANRSQLRQLLLPSSNLIFHLVFSHLKHSSLLLL